MERITEFELTGTTAEDRQRYFEQLCSLPEEVLRGLWENSEVHDQLQKISERLAGAHWELSRDTIKCSKCGFGFFPDGPWFQDSVCISHNKTDFRPNYCPNCGARMKKD